MKRRHSVLAACAVLALTTACARPPASPTPIAEVRGYYTPGFEVSRFIACGAAPTDQPWWVVLSPRALQQRDSLMALVRPAPGPRVFVRWRGIIGAPGSTGHLGRSTRHIHVTELLEMRTPGDGDCEQD